MVEDYCVITLKRFKSNYYILLLGFRWKGSPCTQNPSSKQNSCRDFPIGREQKSLNDSVWSSTLPKSTVNPIAVAWLQFRKLYFAVLFLPFHFHPKKLQSNSICIHCSFVNPAWPGLIPFHSVHSGWNSGDRHSWYNAVTFLGKWDVPIRSMKQNMASSLRKLR